MGMLKEWRNTRYPGIMLFLVSILIAYAIFKSREVLPLQELILSSGYIGVFIAGIFYTYGFTSPPATAVFLILAQERNIYLSALVGGIGALVGDLIIFGFLRYSVEEEIEKMSKEKLIRKLNNKIPHFLKKYAAPIFGMIAIASPLPDELGISLLALSKGISNRIFMAISYIANTAGIFVILLIGSAI